MLETWRWFGPNDSVTLSDIRQAGASGVVTALYDVPPGAVWSAQAIAKRHEDVRTHANGAPSGLEWSVTESLPVSEAIKAGSMERDEHIQNWITSMRNLAAEGMEVICYNFMPILDWTRTDLASKRPSGAKALRFDLVDFAAFDIHILNRDNAAADYEKAICERAETHAAKFSNSDAKHLSNTILAGLPGAVEGWTLESFKQQVGTYRDLDSDGLRVNLQYFLQTVVPEAEKLGVRLCCHPDDPPWPLFGLPRIISTLEDYQWLIQCAPSASNGVTFCTGSLGARGDNDLPNMVKQLAPHIHFLHLRNVHREADTVPCSFFEDDHLDGSTDMLAVIEAIVIEQSRRKSAGRRDWKIPMRPDHGQQILADMKSTSAPGYPAIGRLKGLAELRGAYRATERLLEQAATDT